MSRFKPEIEIREHMYPGYGSARGGYHVRVIYDNRLLEEERGSESEVDMGAAIGRLSAKWIKRWDAEKFGEIVRNAPLASRLCDNCGRDTLDGSASVHKKVFCLRDECEPAIAAYQQELRDETERYRLKSEADRIAREDAERAATRDALSGAFHWQNDWYFKRLPDGSVRVMHKGADDRWLIPDIAIPPNEWASIVSSVSAGGETGDRWRQALEFHNNGDRP